MVKSKSFESQSAFEKELNDYFMLDSQFSTEKDETYPERLNYYGKIDKEVEEYLGYYEPGNNTGFMLEPVIGTAAKGKMMVDFEVELGAEPNPDFDRSSHEGTVNIKKHRVKVKSMSEARDKVVKFIMDNDLGSGNWVGGDIYQYGKKVGYISYNGRIWDNQGNSIAEKGAWFKEAVEEKKENLEMVMNEAYQIQHHAQELLTVLKKNVEVPAWVVAKIHSSAENLSASTHYLAGTKGMSNYANGGGMKQEWVAVFRNMQRPNEQKVIQAFGNNKTEAIRDAEMSRNSHGISKEYQLVNIYTYSGNPAFEKDYNNGGGVTDSLTAYENWRNSPAFNDAITSLNEDDIDYSDWSDIDIYRWWVKHEKSSDSDIAANGKYIQSLNKKIDKAIASGRAMNLFRKMEDENYHSEAAFLVAKAVGTPQDIQDMAEIVERHYDSEEGIDSDDYRKRYEIQARLWPSFIEKSKVKKSKAADGMMMDDGKSTESKEFYDFKNDLEYAMMSKYNVFLSDAGITNEYIKMAMNQGKNVDEIVDEIAKEYDLVAVNPASSAMD